MHETKDIILAQTFIITSFIMYIMIAYRDTVTKQS